MTRGGPGGFDVNALMKQAQQMQDEMLQAQEKLKDEVVEASGDLYDDAIGVAHAVHRRRSFAREGRCAEDRPHQRITRLLKGGEYSVWILNVDENPVDAHMVGGFIGCPMRWIGPPLDQIDAGRGGIIADPDQCILCLIKRSVEGLS